jgi:hypothetical protein
MTAFGLRAVGGGQCDHSGGRLRDRGNGPARTGPLGGNNAVACRDTAAQDVKSDAQSSAQSVKDNTGS